MSQKKLEDFKEFRPIIEQLRRMINKVKSLRFSKEDKSEQTTLDYSS